MIAQLDDWPPHRCPVRGCHRDDVPADMLMCGRHWHMVPGPVQRAVWRAWQDGDGRGSMEHLAAIEAAIASVNRQVAQ